jgi:hypothetical protein
LTVPEGIRLVHRPPCRPERQPAETLWPRLAEPVANRPFETLEQLDQTVAARTLELDQRPRS